MVDRWSLYDPATSDTWVFPYNPSQMGSLFGPRNIQSRTTTAIDGQPIVFEGNRSPVQWTFSGFMLDHAHHETLRTWVYERPNRLQLTDHFGRVIDLDLVGMESTPKRDRNRYWHHEYTITALVHLVGAATVGI